MARLHPGKVLLGRAHARCILRGVTNSAAPLVIFDFDGTLVDSLGVALTAYNSVAARFGVRVVSDAEMPELRALGAMAVIRRLGVPLWKVPRVVAAVRTEMKRGLDEAGPVPGIVAALNDLVATGCALGVLTSNSRENAERFFSRHGFPSFAQIVGGVGLFGKSKALRHLQRSRLAGAERCAYVGDEVRDIEAARAVGMPVVAVGWGYNDLAALEGTRPDVLVKRPAALARSVALLLGPPHAEVLRPKP